MNRSETYWVAGILEGEGCFSIKRRGKRKGNGKPYRYPTIEVNMADEDVIRRLQSITKTGNVQGPYKDKRHPKWAPMWRWTLQSAKEAADFMLRLYPLMGKRRKSKIKKILCEFGTPCAKQLK